MCFVECDLLSEHLAVVRRLELIAKVTVLGPRSDKLGA